MRNTSSPRACARPVIRALWWPKLRDRSTMRTRGSRSRIRSATASESSGDPSLTKTNSYDDEMAEIARTMREWNSSRYADERYMEVTMDNRTSLVIGSQALHVAG